MAVPPTEPVAFTPYVSPTATPKEFTFVPVFVGAILGIVFGASSVYLVLKVGLTVSASIPVAVLSITVFKGLSRVLGLRPSTILENNIAQTTGSAGESIAFGIGLVMPALLVLGFDIDVIRVMTVGVLGGLLGILMMIPLRRAFVVKKHGELKYPEGTACADVLIAGEKGGSTARILFIGFGLGFVFQWLMKASKLWKEEIFQPLTTASGAGLKGGILGCEVNPSLLGVGYIIGPRIASIMVAGGILAYLVLTPTIYYFGENLDKVLPPAKSKIDEKTGKDVGLIRNMDVSQVRGNYILYIGAGAVAAGGIISMLNALPVIFGSLVGGLRDMRGGGGGGPARGLRTERDLPMSVVLFGSLGLVFALAAAPQLGLGLNYAGVAGAVLVLLFGFLFVTVSSRLTGEIGSSSNPISGMTVATLLLTCLVLLGLSELGVITIGKETKLLALMIAAVVCIACSNGGTTSQALKTGYLVGATPIWQQYAILIGSLTSAVVVGGVLLAMNEAGTVYTKKGLPTVTVDVSKLAVSDRVNSGQYSAEDKNTYKVLLIGKQERIDPALFVNAGPKPDVAPGRYLVSADGAIVYRCDPAVNGGLKFQDDGKPVANKFNAPKTELIALIIDGVLDRDLPWSLVLLGVLIAVSLELSGVPSLPFAVGVYLPLEISMPVFLGGAIRWAADKFRRSAADAGDSSPGVLLGSGYIAGASIATVIVAFLGFNADITEWLDWSNRVKGVLIRDVEWVESNIVPAVTFGLLVAVLFAVGTERFGKKVG